MSLSNLSKHDAITLLELIHASLSCVTEDEFRKLTLSLKALIPYDHAACLMGKSEKASPAMTYELINITFPSEWLEQYVINEYHRIDPIVKENFANFNIQYWADTYKIYGPPKEFVMAAEDFGLKKGYSHGVRNYKGTEGSLFSFSGRYIDNNPRTELILKHIIPNFHNALSRITGRNIKNSVQLLSPREREVLRWISCGKNSWDVSEILGISERTIKFHMQNIMQKLNSINRSHAVATAIEQGLIDADLD